jgi:hypothetical protein
MRTGVELLLSNYFSKLLSEGYSANDAIDKIGHMVFEKYKMDFLTLNDYDQWEVRNYINCLWKLFK